jgi:hypothetical protein
MALNNKNPLIIKDTSARTHPFLLPHKVVLRIKPSQENEIHIISLRNPWHTSTTRTLFAPSALWIASLSRNPLEPNEAYVVAFAPPASLLALLFLG